MKEVFFRLDGDVLVPNSADAHESVRGWLDGQIVAVRPYSGKREAMIRLVHVLCQKGADNAPKHILPEAVKSQAMLHCGLVKDVTIAAATGDVSFRRQSLTELDEATLSDFIERLKDWIVTELCPGMDPKLLEREVNAGTARAKG